MIPIAYYITLSMPRWLDRTGTVKSGTLISGTYIERKKRHVKIKAMEGSSVGLERGLSRPVGTSIDLRAFGALYTFYLLYNYSLQKTNCSWILGVRNRKKASARAHLSNYVYCQTPKRSKGDVLPQHVCSHDKLFDFSIKMSISIHVLG